MNSNSSLCQQGIELELSTPLDPHTHSNILHSFMFLFEQSPTNIKYLLPYSIITTFIMGKCSKTIAHLCRGRDIN